MVWFNRIGVVTENEDFTPLITALSEIKRTKMLLEVMLRFPFS